MSKYKFHEVLSVIAMLLLPACATVIRGPNVEFNVVTEPPGASVTTDLKTGEMLEHERRNRRLVKYSYLDESEVTPVVEDYHGCEPTPCKMQISRRSEFLATITLPGYHPMTVDITSGFGKGEPTKATGGAIISAAGGYVLAQTVISATLTPWVAITGLGGVGSGVAGSAATTAATGVGVSFLMVDVISGAMLDVRPNPLVVILVPETEPFPEGDAVLIETQEQLETILQNRPSVNLTN